MSEWDNLTFVKEKMLKPDIQREESQALYDHWIKAGTYDKLLGSKGDGAVQTLSEVTKDLWPKDALILDCGAGTGLSGLALQRNGYTNLHAIEPHPGLANLIREKGIFHSILEGFIGDEKPIDIRDGTYDGVVSVGSFGPGHIPITAIPEIIRIVKKGGHVVICMKEEYLWTVPEYNKRLEPMMQQMEQEGRWKRIKKDNYPNHFINSTGVMFHYQIC